MGIFVPEATLPSGFTLTNVYMSFSGEPVYLSPMGPSQCQIYSYYKVWTDNSKSKPSDIRILLTIQGADSNVSAYTTLYNALKSMYPNAQDSLVNYAPTSATNTINPPAPEPTATDVTEPEPTATDVTEPEPTATDVTEPEPTAIVISE